MKTILVPTDFSNAAMNAAEYAMSFAKEINANVLLMHAYNVPMALAGDVPILAITPEELQKDNEKLLKKEAARLKKKTNVEIKYKAKMGLAVDEIREEEKKVDFIVMGMTGAGKLSEFLLGSITTATLKKVKTPVIVIPEKVNYKSPEKIALATDYALINIDTLDILKELAKTFGSKIYVVNVKEQKEEVSVKGVNAETKWEAQLSGTEHFYFFPEHDDLVEGVNEFVKTEKADMVAVIPHRYNLIEGLFHKSFSKKMAFHTQVPLLILPDNHKKTNA
jgi:nucleotide-binding universal stress UspA family protein